MRWIRGAIPVAAVALVTAGAVARPPVLEAADPPWTPTPCTASAPPGASPGAWFRVDGVLDATGTLAGQRLWLGVVGGWTRRMELPPESFATGPSGMLVLVGADDGARSRVAIVDVARACLTVVADEAAVVRSALLAPDGRSIVEHRVDRVTRADLGTWRVPLGGGRATRLLAGVAADERYGPTFTTELRWAADGRLGVTSCGDTACRTRVLDPATGRATLVGPTGPVLGVDAGGGVIAHAVCTGYPCALVRMGAVGEARTLVPAAGRASLEGGTLVYETPDGGVVALDVIDGDTRRIDGADGLVPIRTGSASTAGATHPGGDVVLARDGLLDGGSGRVLAPGETTTRPLMEVAP